MTSTSTGPSSASARATAASTASASATSASSARSTSAAAARSIEATARPSARNAAAHARPIPDAAPLTTAHAMAAQAIRGRAPALLCDRTMSTPTVRKLADDPSLGLRLLAGAAAADRAIAGAHTTDLDQPARYLLPGELVLTNGLWTEHVDGATWAAEVATAGAVAIGFGLADHHPAVPADLLAACDELGLPLLEVPEDLSFSMITAAAADGGDPSGLRLQLSRTRRLLQRLGAGGGHAALLDFLRHETRLPVWLVGPGGRAPDGCEPVPDRGSRAWPPAPPAAASCRPRSAKAPARSAPLRSWPPARPCWSVRR